MIDISYYIYRKGGLFDMPSRFAPFWHSEQVQRIPECVSGYDPDPKGRAGAKCKPCDTIVLDQKNGPESEFNAARILEVFEFVGKAGDARSDWLNQRRKRGSARRSASPLSLPLVSQRPKLPAPAQLS
jgi:hypothetical protein